MRYNQCCLTIDTEWAHPIVLQDTVNLFDSYGIGATFFCTHPGIHLTASHETALHPNFRRDGDTVQKVLARLNISYNDIAPAELIRHVLQETLSMYPQAVGLRTHSLYYDSDLMPVLRDFGVAYDSSVYLPLASHLQPVRKEYGIIEFPIYYMDHLDLTEKSASFTVDALQLSQPGLKVFDFHPNLIFINAPTMEHYTASKSFYHDPQKLLEHRHPGKGVRTLFIELLEYIRDQNIPHATLKDLNDAFRASLT